MGARTGRLRSVSGAVLGVARARSVGGPLGPRLPDDGLGLRVDQALASWTGYPNRCPAEGSRGWRSRPDGRASSMFVGSFAPWPAPSPPRSIQRGGGRRGVVERAGAVRTRTRCRSVSCAGDASRLGPRAQASQPRAARSAISRSRRSRPSAGPSRTARARGEPRPVS